jgi:phosphoglycolate phosphatase
MLEQDSLLIYLSKEKEVKMKYQYIVFDFNGTLINDVDLCLDLLNEMLRMKNLPEVSEDKYKHIFTFPIKTYYQNAGFDFKDYSFEELSLYFIKKYQPASLLCGLYPDVEKTLGYLKNQGYHLILLSASKLDNLKEQTDHYHISSYFDSILGLDNIAAKGKVDIAQEYFTKNHINGSKCLFIGDTLHDVEVSSSLGSDIYLVNFGHQHQDILKTSGKNIISSYQELMQLL